MQKIESAKLRARLTVQNCTWHARNIEVTEGYFSVAALEARQEERRARDAYVRVLDEAIDLCQAGARP